MKLPQVKLPQLGQLKGTKLVTIIIGLIVGSLVLAGGFLLVQGVFTEASDANPRDIVINGLTENSAKISWTTDQETQGVIEYGSSPTSLNLFAPESAKERSHTVELSLLTANTSYYFQIRIGDTKYDNGGVPWTFTTKSKNAITPTGPAVSPTASPSAAVTIVTPTLSLTKGPIPTQSLRITLAPTPLPTATPYAIPTLALFVCGETDCVKICQKIGMTCSTQDWMKSGCVGKVTLGSCFSVTPTLTPTPSPTSNPLTPTATPTLTPTPTSGPTATPAPTIPSYMQ